MDRTFCIAPMMDWTDHYCRAFHRHLTRRSILYTEMVTTGALIHGNRAQHLDFYEIEHPVALQLGGADPDALAQCAEMAEARGYDEVNLNIGCPSDRVQNGRFGACLMAEPELVSQCVKAMVQATSLPVTVKCRIGIDDQDERETLFQFVGTVANAGCRTFIIHARKAWLKGLSPKENRSVPPLNYELVYELKQAHPDLEIILNGGIKTLAESRDHLTHLDGVMMGREAYSNPGILATVDQDLYGDPRPVLSAMEILENFRPFLVEQLAAGVPLKNFARHMLGLFNGQPGAKAFRRHLSENMSDPIAGLDLLDEALGRLSTKQLEIA